MALLEDILRNVQQDKSRFASDTRTSSVVTRSDWLKNAFTQSMSQGGSVGSAPKVPQPTGFKGFVSDVLNNPIVKPIVNSLDVLAMPGRAVASTVQEFLDAVDGNPNTRATFNDFTKQIGDPTFGFGTITGDITGSSFVNRLIGFAGDVVLDPLTYLTLGGSKALTSGAKLAKPVASAEGRFALASKMFELGADPDVVKQVARRGRSAVRDPDLLAKAGYDRAGVYWMGKRIPGSTRVGEAAESMFTSFRVWSGDHVFKRIGDLFTPGDMVDLRRQIARGDVSSEKASDFIGMVLSRNEERAVEAASERVAKDMRRTNLASVTAEDITTSRGTAYKLIENPTVVPDPSTSGGRVATAVVAHLQAMHDSIVKAGQAVDPKFSIGQVDNYVPHMPTDKAWRWMANTNLPSATSARGEVFNPFDDAGSYKNRLAEGDTVGTYELTQADIDGGIDRLNEIFRQEYKVDFNFFETDLPTILDKYDRMYASMMGKIARKKYLVDKGIYQRVERNLITDPVIQKAAQKQLKKVTATRSKYAKRAEKKVIELADSMEGVFDAEIGRIQGQIDELTAPISKSLMAEGNASYAKQSLMRGLEEAKSDLNESYNAFQRNLDEAAQTPLVQAMDRQMGSLVERLESIAEEVNLLDFSDAAIKTNVKPVLDKLRTLGDDIAEAQRIEKRMITVGNTMAEHLEAILNGSDVKDVVSVGRRLRGSFDSPVKPDVAAKRMVYGETVDDATLSRMSKARRQNYKAYTGAVRQGWWREIQDALPLPASKVERYAQRKNIKKKLQELARSSGQRGEFGDTSAVEEMRAMGAALVAWIDTMPDDIAREFADLKTDLVEAIVMASRSADYYKKLVSKRAKTRGVITIQNVADNFVDVAERTENTLLSYFAAQQLRSRIFSAVDISAQADEIVPTSLLERILQDSEFSSLEPYLGRFVDDSIDSVDSFSEIQKLMQPGEADDLSRYGNITYGELEQVLGRIVSDGEKTTFDLTLRTGTGIDNLIERPSIVGPNGVAKVRMSDYIARVVESSGGGAVSQKQILDVMDADFYDVYSNWWGSFRDQVRNLPNPGAKGRVELDIFPKTTRVTIGGRGQRSPLRELERRAVQTGQKSKEQAKESLQKKSMEFLAAIDDDLRPNEVLSAEDAYDRLNNLLLQTYFKTEIEYRFSSLTRQMLTEGLVPDKDLYRLVVNTVARELSDHSMAQVASYSYASSKLQSILDVIDGASADRTRLRGIINDPSVDAKVRMEARKQLDAIPSSGYWLGREEELYDTVTKMLSAEGRNMELDWRTVVADANGSHHAESLFAELRRLGGAKQQAGVTNRLRKLRQEFNAATDLETRARIKAEIDSIEASKPFINKARRELLEKRLRPWYRRNVDPSAKSPSLEIIEAALKDRKKINKAGGRLDPTATVAEIRTWVQIASQNIDESARRTRRNFEWTVAASDPFLDVSKFEPGVNNLRDLSLIHAASLRSAAQQLEDDAGELASARMAVGRTMPVVEAAEDKAALAERELRELTRKGGRIKGLVPDEEVPSMLRARQISERIVAIKNTTNYLGAVERAELNELLMEMAKYSVRQDIPLENMVDPGRVAAGLIEDGVVVFQKKTPADPDELLKIEELRRRIDMLQKSIYSRKDAAARSAREVDDRYSDPVREISDEQFKQEVLTGKDPIARQIRKRLTAYINMHNNLLDAGDVQGADDAFWTGANKLMQEEFGLEGLPTKTSIGERVKIGVVKRQISESQKQLDRLTNRNPLGGERYKEVIEASSTKKGVVYFKFADGSGFKTGADVIEHQKKIARAVKAGDERLANSLRIQLDRAMVPVGTRVDTLTVNGRALTLNEDLFKGLFDDINEVIVDVADNGTVRQFTVQQVALQKMSDILQAIKSGEISKEDFIDALRYTSSRKQSELYHTYPEAHTSRVTALETAWEKSGDKKILDEISTLEAEESLSRYRALLSDREMVIQQATKLREESRRVTGQVGRPGAPYGYEKYSGGNFFRFRKEELDRIEAEEYERLLPEYGKTRAEEMARAAAKRRMQEASDIAVQRAKTIPYTEPTVGLLGAEFRFNRSMEKLNTIFDNIKRTTNNQYDPYQRFVEITSDGTSISDAMRIIDRELREVRPDDQSFIKLADTIEPFVERAEALRMQFKFLESNIDDEIFGRYVYGSAGMSPDDVFPLSANDLRLEMAGIESTLSKLQKERMKMLRRAMNPTYKKSQDAIGKASVKVTKLQAELERASSLFDDAAIFRMSTQDQYARVVPELRERLDNLIAARDRIPGIIANNPTAEQKYSELLLFQGEVEELFRELGTIKSGAADLTVNADSVLNPPGFPPLPGTVLADGAPKLTKEYEKFLLVKAQFLNAWHEFAIVDEFQAQALATMEDLKDLKWGVMVDKTLKKGWSTLEELGLPSYMATTELLEISKNMERIIQPEFVRGLNRFIGSYTGFIKSYLTASPGFVVRNTLGNSFMLVAAGGEIKNLSKGLNLYRAWTTAVKEGVEKEFISKLPQAERELFEQALKASDASGYGKAADAVAGWQPKRQVLKDNKYTRLFRDMNTASEGSARFMLAYDSVAKGMDFNMATARVKKYLFDYVDVGAADEALRSIIPFWFWMSRNLPMQIANRWTNPRAYLMYDKLMKALRDDREDQYLPSWMVTAGAVRLTDNMYLNLDLGFNKIDEELQMLGDPAKFLGKLNPAIKVPAELLFNKRLGYNTDFNEEGVDAPGSLLSPAVQALAGLLGQSRDTESGGRGVSDKFSYALQSILPPLAQGERLLPATEGGQERQGNALLSYFGVPLRNVSDADRQRELNRQYYLMQNQ